MTRQDSGNDNDKVGFPDCTILLPRPRPLLIVFPGPKLPAPFSDPLVLQI